MVDIEILDSIFLNIKTNLILYFYPEKCKKFNHSTKDFVHHLKLYTETGGTLYFMQKTGLRRKSKVCPLDIRLSSRD